jgi:hypothetical protein
MRKTGRRALGAFISSAVGSGICRPTAAHRRCLCQSVSGIRGIAAGGLAQSECRLRPGSVSVRLAHASSGTRPSRHHRMGPTAQQWCRFVFIIFVLFLLLSRRRNYGHDGCGSSLRYSVAWAVFGVLGIVLGRSSLRRLLPSSMFSRMHSRPPAPDHDVRR